MPSLLTLAIAGDLSAFMQDYKKGLADTLTKTVRATANTIRSRVQKQIARNFSLASRGGAKLARALVQKNTPKSGASLAPWSRVYSKALYEAGKYGRTVAVDLIDLYQTAATVTAANRQWLAVPTPEAPLRGGRGGGKTYATPAQCGVALEFLRTARADRAVLVPKKWTRGGKRPVLYVLIKKSPRTARIDVGREVDRAIANLPGFYQKQFDRIDRDLTTRYGRGLNGPMLLE